MELSQFAISIITDERGNCRRFEDGLQEQIQTVVTLVAYTEFGKLTEAALIVEHSLGKSHQHGFCNYNQNWLVGGTLYKQPKRGNNSLITKIILVKVRDLFSGQ